MTNELKLHTTTSGLASPLSLSARDRSIALSSKCDQGMLMDNIRDLLSLGWQPNETMKERLRITALFVADLSEFSDYVVHSAIRDWRQNETKRPTPAGLRKICMMYRQKLSRVYDRVTPAPPDPKPEPRPERSEELKASFARIAKQAGFVEKNGVHMMPEMAREADDEKERTPHWTETGQGGGRMWQALEKARAENPLMNPDRTE